MELLLVLNLITQASLGISIQCDNIEETPVKFCSNGKETEEGCSPEVPEVFHSLFDNQTYTYLGTRTYSVSCTTTCDGQSFPPQPWEVEYRFTLEDSYPQPVTAYLGDDLEFLDQCKDSKFLGPSQCIKKLESTGVTYETAIGICEKVPPGEGLLALGLEVLNPLMRDHIRTKRTLPPFVANNPDSSPSACAPEHTEEATFSTERTRSRGLSLYLSNQHNKRRTLQPCNTRFKLDVFEMDTAHLETRAWAPADLDVFTTGRLPALKDGGVVGVHAFDEQVYPPGSDKLYRHPTKDEEATLARYVQDQLISEKMDLLETEVQFLGEMVAIPTLVNSVDNGLVLPLTFSRLDTRGNVHTESYLAIVDVDDYGYTFSLEPLEDTAQLTHVSFGESTLQMCKIEEPFTEITNWVKTMKGVSSR